MNAFVAHRRQRAGGFTLIEVLVAVAVLALALGAFVASGAQYADNARYLQERTLALWVARNRMAEYLLAEDWPSTGDEEGSRTMGDREWQWRAEITESPDPAVRRIDLSVHRFDPNEDRAEDQSLATLSGFVTENIDSNSASQTQSPQ